MVAELVEYVILILVMVAGLWLAARLLTLGLPGGGRGGSYTGLDTEYDFDRAWAEHRRRRRLAVLFRRSKDLELPLLDAVAPLALAHQRYLGEQVIPLASVVGSVDGAAGRFDRGFRPASRDVRARLESVLVAMHSGVSLPPIDVYRWHGGHYVLDGHHRVAAARALGWQHIPARVTEIG